MDIPAQLIDAYLAACKKKPLGLPECQFVIDGQKEVDRTLQAIGDFIREQEIKLLNQVWDILVAHAGARENDRQNFVLSTRGDMFSEWRFQGVFGFGGKIYRESTKPGARFRVGFYHEDSTEEREALRNKVNDELTKLTY